MNPRDVPRRIFLPIATAMACVSSGALVYAYGWSVRFGGPFELHILDRPAW